MHIDHSWESLLQLRAPISLHWNMGGPDAFVAKKIILIWRSNPLGSPATPPPLNVHPVGKPQCLKSHH